MSINVIVQFSADERDLFRGKNGKAHMRHAVYDKLVEYIQVNWSVWSLSERQFNDLMAGKALAVKMEIAHAPVTDPEPTRSGSDQGVASEG